MVCGRLAHGDSCVIATWDNLRYTLFFSFEKEVKVTTGKLWECIQHRRGTKYNWEVIEWNTSEPASKAENSGPQLKIQMFDRTYYRNHKK